MNMDQTGKFIRKLTKSVKKTEIIHPALMDSL